eukprot:TRINITY_DN18920_c0_g1_i1.p1 TRINITY_DN18920_c0_g1~~TRINITY_DN18920_c0_g1_i1.p1  ORF type:complete len:551 (-),score=183.57 TRINITY_DN18920_c0_g1_i1:90-1742(-)
MRAQRSCGVRSQITRWLALLFVLVPLAAGLSQRTEDDRRDVLGSEPLAFDLLAKRAASPQQAAQHHRVAAAVLGAENAVLTARQSKVTGQSRRHASRRHPSLPPRAAAAGASLLQQQQKSLTSAAAPVHFEHVRVDRTPRAKEASKAAAESPDTAAALLSGDRPGQAFAAAVASEALLQVGSPSAASYMQGLQAMMERQDSKRMEKKQKQGDLHKEEETHGKAQVGKPKEEEEEPPGSSGMLSGLGLVGGIFCVVCLGVAALAMMRGGSDQDAPQASAEDTAAGPARPVQAPPLPVVVEEPEQEALWPDKLYVTSDWGYAGTYKVVQGRMANDMPVWKRDGSEDWMFCGPGGQWFIGDGDEEQANFEVDTGNIASVQENGGRMPDEIGFGGWIFFDAEKGNWTPAQGFNITSEHFTLQDQERVKEERARREIVPIQEDEEDEEEEDESEQGDAGGAFVEASDPALSPSQAAGPPQAAQAAPAVSAVPPLEPAPVEAAPAPVEETQQEAPAAPAGGAEAPAPVQASATKAKAAEAEAPAPSPEAADAEKAE